MVKKKKKNSPYVLWSLAIEIAVFGRYCYKSNDLCLSFKGKDNNCFWYHWYCGCLDVVKLKYCIESIRNGSILDYFPWTKGFEEKFKLDIPADT